MALDLSKVVAQVTGMVARLKDGRRERQEHLQRALETLGRGSADMDRLKRKVAAARTSWLVAELTDRPDRRFPAPPLPPDFAVIAADGSQIEVDRHRSTRCYLINLGSVLLHYGSAPGAVLDSFPHLYSEDSDLAIAAGGREQMVEGPLLALKRSVEECGHLAHLAGQLPAGSTALALLDGTLILWQLETQRYPEAVVDVMLRQGFLAHLETMRRLNSGRKLAPASYISYPRSTDVVNVLRVALCPHEPVDCDRYCREKRECDGLAGVRDQDVFASLLADGERTATFVSASKIQEQYGEHRVHFYYLKAGEEIARVEVPQWVAGDESLLDITHTLVLDQCRRGQGYPVALSEAHEQAVVTNADRESFWELVESAAVDEHVPSSGSAKNLSKRTRWI